MARDKPLSPLEIMSSGSTSMTSPAAPVNDYIVECRACYGVVVSCVSLLIFCVVAGTAGVLKAGAATCFAMALLGAVGWFVPSGARTRMLLRARGARRAAGDLLGGASADRCTWQRRGVAAADVPPAFKYECPEDDDVGNGGGGKPGGSSALLCAVCLECVRRGEEVRRLPACEHLFHKECVDLWLRSHTTCPLCRRDVVQQACAEKTVVSAGAAQSSRDVSPPV